MRLFTVDNKAVDLIMVQQRLLGNYSQLQIDMCGIIDRSEPPKPVFSEFDPCGNMALEEIIMFVKFLDLRYLLVSLSGCEHTF